MDYVCLAAGKGTRFGELGRYLQKCMYPVGLRPFVELSVANLLESHYTDLDADTLTFIVGHHAEQLEHYFGNSYQGLPVTYLHQTEQLGTGHALHLFSQKRQVEQPVVAWLADAYVTTERFERVQAHAEVNVQTVAPGPADEKPDLKVTTDGDLITKAWRGTEPMYDCGLWKLSPAVLALMTTRRDGEYRMVPNLQLALERGHRVGVIRAEEWLHLGGVHPTPEENVLSVVERVLELERSVERTA